jgi:hypothetical protein
MIAVAIAFSASGAAHAGALNSAAECAVGMRVTTSDGHKGTITRIDRDWSYCYVQQDDTGKNVGYLYSLLSPEGSTADSGSSGQLAVGKYDCWIGEQGAGEMRITGPSTYESEGNKGKYHLESSGKIVFESGPFSTFNSKILSGHRIGINMSGGNFYNMACDPPK